MVTILLAFSLLCLVAIVVGLFVPAARPVAIAAGAILLYLPSLVAWWFIIYFRYVDFDKLVAPYRWTRHGRAVEGFWFFGPPLLPSVFLLLICAGVFLHRRRIRAWP